MPSHAVRGEKTFQSLKDLQRYGSKPRTNLSRFAPYFRGGDLFNTSAYSNVVKSDSTFDRMMSAIRSGAIEGVEVVKGAKVYRNPEFSGPNVVTRITVDGVPGIIMKEIRHKPYKGGDTYAWYVYLASDKDKDKWECYGDADLNAFMTVQRNESSSLKEAIRESVKK